MLTENTFIHYRSILLEIEYKYNKYIPATTFESNGEPGYPSEGGDLYINEIIHGDENIISLFTEDMLDEISNIIQPNVNF
jgi:hypothetical protein